uniref:Fe2OG dioxygenase domain-containing protein n=1 Tax=Amphora coffeiformis TaxID=265554 RepID=A0A7S3L7B8_9STRA|mmetsp:Transcript_7140/g.13647  ORF Transcript_7140/g.13647 Transcript_7140/m.13647 type:complete len:275 (+) Transcript_7140:44-868(+)|eukprot:scaffold11193_cov166-Amphora_coffeaeformis.AAC.4
MPATNIEDVAKELLQSIYVHVPVDRMRCLLEGSVDLASLTPFWDSAAPQQDETGLEVYPGKRSLCSYYNYQSKEPCPSTLGNPGVTLEHIDPTTVHQVSNYRVHKAWPVDAHANPTLLALRNFVFRVLELVFQEMSTTTQDDHFPIEYFQAMQTAYRVIQQPSAVQGNPGPEGVHHDDATLTVIFLIHRTNVQGGVNRVWALAQPNGKPQAADVRLDNDRLVAELLLDQPLDTLLVLDRQVKHEATDIRPIDIHKVAVRDVLTFEVRLRKEQKR